LSTTVDLLPSYSGQVPHSFASQNNTHSLLVSNTRRTTTRIIGFSVLLAVLLAVTATPAQAQFKLGPRVTIDVNEVDAFGFGGDIRYDLSGGADVPVQISAGVDYYSAEENLKVFTADFNGHYMIPVEGAFSPYAGAGVGIALFDFRGGSQFGSTSETFTGLNLVGGIEFQASPLLRPFVQGQITVGSDADRFGITGGLLLSF
jgi:opacity protein-like surface antigen